MSVMPCKVRELKAKLRRCGFDWKPGKGSHTTWRHPLIPQEKITLSGSDGNDAKPYQVKEVDAAIEKLKEKQRE